MPDVPPPEFTPITHECRYPRQIALVERLEGRDIESQMVIGQRRDRLGAILGTAALAGVLTMGSSALIGGLGMARDLGAIEERVRTMQTEQAEQGVRIDGVLVRIERVDRDSSELQSDVMAGLAGLRAEVAGLRDSIRELQDLRGRRNVR
jgi:hypothetical protein